MVRRVSGYKKIRYYTHENIGYGPVNLPDQELHTTAVWWQLPQAALGKAFASKQDALDGFLGAAYALHVVATVAAGTWASCSVTVHVRPGTAGVGMVTVSPARTSTVPRCAAHW